MWGARISFRRCEIRNAHGASSPHDAAGLALAIPAAIEDGFFVLTIGLLLHGGHWIGTSPLTVNIRSS